jgi:predicted nuclease with TOPRIM domain
MSLNPLTVIKELETYERECAELRDQVHDLDVELTRVRQERDTLLKQIAAIRNTFHGLEEER